MEKNTQRFLKQRDTISAQEARELKTCSLKTNTFSVIHSLALSIP